MKKRILFFGLISSFYAFGMEDSSKKLELCCVVEDEPALRSTFFPVTFNEGPAYYPNSRFPTATIIEDPYCLRVCLPPAAHTYLSQDETISYQDTFFAPKEAVVDTLQRILYKTDRDERDKQKSILMTINFPHTGDSSCLKGYSCLIKTETLPQSIKSCIAKSTKSDIQSFYILLPLAILLLLYRFS